MNTFYFLYALIVGSNGDEFDEIRTLFNDLTIAFESNLPLMQHYTNHDKGFRDFLVNNSLCE